MSPSSVDGNPPHRSFPPHQLGAWGEGVAARHLEAEGWRVLERNLRLGRREVDLVMERGHLVVFVEVKTRSSAGYGGPQGAVTWKKRREIEAVARAYLTRLRRPDVDVRFDVIAIVADDTTGGMHSLTHIEDAWRPRD